MQTINPVEKAMIWISQIGLSDMYKRGFTLVEILVVLVIVSLVVGSIGYIFVNKKDDLQSMSLEAVQSIQLVQQRAIKDDKSYQIKIDLESNEINFIDSVLKVPENFSITVKTAANQVIEDKLVGMTFYPDSSSTGGSIVFESEKEIFEILIFWISGKIKTNFMIKQS